MAGLAEQLVGLGLSFEGEADMHWDHFVGATRNALTAKDRNRLCTDQKQSQK
jgi:hypothetical protein